MLTHVNYVMVNVSDMERSVRFYRDALGLSLRFQSPGWTEMETGTTTLALHAVSSPPPPLREARNEPHAGTCSIGFSVNDLDTAVSTLRERGVVFVLPPTDRPEEGIRLAIARDPDGLALSFAQSLT